MLELLVRAGGFPSLAEGAVSGGRPALLRDFVTIASVGPAPTHSALVVEKSRVVPRFATHILFRSLTAYFRSPSRKAYE